MGFVANFTEKAEGGRMAFFALKAELFLLRVAMHFLAETAHNGTSWGWVAFPNAHHAHDVAGAVDGFTHNAVHTRRRGVARLRTQATRFKIATVHTRA